MREAKIGNGYREWRFEMTITINPFVAGIVVTVLAEFVALIVYAIYKARKK